MYVLGTYPCVGLCLRIKINSVLNFVKQKEIQKEEDTSTIPNPCMYLYS